MNTQLMAGIPFLLLIVGALATRRIIEPAAISSVAAVAMLAGADFMTVYIEKMYQVLTDESFQLLVIVGTGFAGMSALLEKSGATLGFRRILEKFCKTRAAALFCTWLLGAVIFIDDYLNALAVSESMKGISDKMRIPREHLAYTVNCMGACVCVLLPVSSWAAFAVSCAAGHGMGMKEYLAAVPLMFYPIYAIIISLLLTAGKLPKLGTLKKAYDRAECGGPLLENSVKMPKDAKEPVKAASPRHFLLPMAALIVGMLAFGQNIIAGMLTGLISRTFPAWSIPLIAFVSVASITFFAASFWSLIVIAFPIFLPMAVRMGVNPSLVIAAIMSGVALGSQACLYSDAIFMVAAGTDVPNDTQFKTALPYVLIGAAAAAVTYGAAGLWMQW